MPAVCLHASTNCGVHHVEEASDIILWWGVSGFIHLITPLRECPVQVPGRRSDAVQSCLINCSIGNERETWRVRRGHSHARRAYCPAQVMCSWTLSSKNRGLSKVAKMGRNSEFTTLLMQAVAFMDPSTNTREVLESYAMAPQAMTPEVWDVSLLYTLLPEKWIVACLDRIGQVGRNCCHLRRPVMALRTRDTGWYKIQEGKRQSLDVERLNTFSGPLPRPEIVPIGKSWKKCVTLRETTLRSNAVWSR